MFWIAGGLVVLLLLCVVAVPGEVFRFARANGRGADGQWDRVRLRKELTELRGFVAGAVILPAMAVVLIGAGAVIVHRFVVPIPFVADVFAGFDPDAALWEQNIETGPQGDLGTEYEHWAAERGIEPGTARFWQEFLAAVRQVSVPDYQKRAVPGRSSCGATGLSSVC